MRDGFRDIVSGWSLVQDVEAIGERIEETARWARLHGPLQADEEAHVRLMIQSQIALAIRQGHFEPFIPADLDDETIRDICNFDA